MENFAKHMNEEELVSVVRAMDNAGKPLSRRYEGDDIALVDLMTRLGCNQTLADKLLITGEILRECVHRGIVISRGN